MRSPERTMLAIAALTGVGVALELVLAGHTATWTQLVPFGLVGIGLCGIALRRPWALRAAAAAVLCGALYGVYEHAAHNYAFEVEIRPEGTVGERALEALYGASPLLAPGSLAVMGLLMAGASGPRRAA